MDRTREARKSSRAAATDGQHRRRHRTIGVRESSEEGQVELMENVRLRAVASKRDRDSSNKNKRRRGFHREEGEPSTEESVGNELDYEIEDAGISRMPSPNTSSSASDQNHRRGFPPARPLSPTPSPPPWKVTDEVIGVTVPRKARSASAKRSHDSWVSSIGVGEEQKFRHQSNSPGRHSVEVVSPSSSSVSVRKKMKATGPKTRLLKTSKPSSSKQEDIEIEIAELLYGLRTSRNQESSKKLETNGAHGNSDDSKSLIPSQSTNPQTSVLPRSTSPSSDPSKDAETKKVEDDNYSTPTWKSSTAKSVKNEREQPAKEETFSPESAKISGFNDNSSTGRKSKSSEAPKEEIKKDNLDSGAGYGVTTDGRSVSLTGELPSCFKSDVDKDGSATTRVISAVPDANSQQVEKLEIDLMAPPMVLSPERDVSETRALALDVELTIENNIKIEDKEERLVKKEDTPEEIKDTKIDMFKEKQDVLNIDLEMPNKDTDSLTNDKLEENDRTKELPPKLTDPKVEKTAQSTPVSLSTTVPAWPSSLSPLGYSRPLQTEKTDKTTGSSIVPQHLNFALSPPRPKRCATHHYIACNIILHQQFTKMNHVSPATIGPGSLCGAKPNNVNGVPTSERMVVVQQSQKNLPRVNQKAPEVKKELVASSFPGLTENEISDAAISVDSMQMKQQGPHLASAGNLMHGSAFLFSLGQHQPSSITATTSQVGGVNSTSSASSNKSNCSSAGSLGTTLALPPVTAAMSFSYPNLAANDAPYVTIVQNNGYPFSFSTPQGATVSIRGASPAPAAHNMFNGPFYSSQMFHPFQHPQQHPHSQALVQPGYLNTSTSIGSSSSHKLPNGAQVNGNVILSSTTMQLQGSQKQSTLQSHPRKLEIETGGEKAPSVASRTSYSQKNVYGQNFTIPVQPTNFSFRPSATSDSVGGNNGNIGVKKQQALKGGVELVPSQAFALSFAAFNGISVPSNLSFSSMAQSPMIFHSLPNVAWQGYHSPGTSHATQQKSYSMSEGKSGGNSNCQDAEKKVNSGKSSGNGPTTLVFDNSSKNLSFVLSPTNGSWPSHSIASTAITSNETLSSNASSSQQMLQLQKQHNGQQQQPPMATRYKASNSTTSATKFINSLSVFSQTFTQCNSSNLASHSKSSGKISDSQVLQTSVITATAPTLKNVSQEQGRVLQGHTQISFGGNYKSSLPLQGQQQLSNNLPLNTIFVGSPPNGSNSKPNSQGSKVGSSINALQTQQGDNSSARTGQKSSPVCGRNVPSILSSCPSHLSELKY